MFSVLDKQLLDCQWRAGGARGVSRVLKLKLEKKEKKRLVTLVKRDDFQNKMFFRRKKLNDKKNNCILV